MNLSLLLNRILSMIFPDRCIFCGEVFYTEEKVKICRKCQGENLPLAPPCCKKCGCHIVNKEGLCFSCKRENFSFLCNNSLWEYSGKEREAVLNFKSKGRYEYGKTLSLLMAEDIAKRHLAEGIDLLLPVPLHRSKEIARGYNQSALLAKGIGRALNIPAELKALARIKKTLPQMELNKKERKQNILNSMKVLDDKLVAGKNILLIDDIFTTGSTLNECSKVLLKSGAGSVSCYTLCIAKRHRQVSAQTLSNITTKYVPDKNNLYKN